MNFHNIKACYTESLLVKPFSEDEVVFVKRRHSRAQWAVIVCFAFNRMNRLERDSERDSRNFLMSVLASDAIAIGSKSFSMYNELRPQNLSKLGAFSIERLDPPWYNPTMKMVHFNDYFDIDPNSDIAEAIEAVYEIQLEKEGVRYFAKAGLFSPSTIKALVGVDPSTSSKINKNTILTGVVGKWQVESSLPDNCTAFTQEQIDHINMKYSGTSNVNGVWACDYVIEPLCSGWALDSMDKPRMAYNKLLSEAVCFNHIKADMFEDDNVYGFCAVSQMWMRFANIDDARYYASI